jgi:VanZ family protein
MSPDRSLLGISRHSRAWLWVGAWALFIFGLGSDDLSFDHTSRFLGPLIRWLLPSVSEATADWIHFTIRKSAHLVEYAILGFFTLRALAMDRAPALPRATWIALILTAAFAAVDETRQSLTATRIGSFWDVLLDTLGAAAGIALLRWASLELPGFDRRIGMSRGPEPKTTDVTNGETTE